MTFLDVTDVPTICTQMLQTRSVWLSELEKGNLTKEPITTMRLWLRGRCPEVTRALIILATAHDGMQTKQIRFKHLYYTSLLAWEAGNQAKISTQHLGWNNSGEDETTLRSTGWINIFMLLQAVFTFKVSAHRVWNFRTLKNKYININK